MKVAKFIKKTPLSKKIARIIGVNDKYYKKATEIDRFGDSQIVYGGIDISKDSTGKFKVIEINPRVQAMGLQDFRQETLSIPGEPNLLNDFISWLHDGNYKNITLLGSTKNAFYRGYDRITETLNLNGINTVFTDSEGLKGLYNLGYETQLIFRNCNNEVIINDPEIKSIIEDRHMKIVNPLHASFYGYRGFLKIIYDELLEVLPHQITLSDKTTEKDLVDHPWLKLEANGEEYVVNYNELRRWGKTSVLSILHGDFGAVSQNLKDKTGGDAKNIRKVADLIQNSNREDVVWIAQENVEPPLVDIKLEGVQQKTRLLYRTYWLYRDDRSVAVSAECFGCTEDQFKKSKGKINAGTGFSVPIKNFKRS